MTSIRKGKLDKAILSKSDTAKANPENFDVLACFEQICIAYP